MKKGKILLDQLDNRIEKLKEFGNISKPQSGWVNSVRLALSMSLRQLGNMMSMKAPSVKEIEQREVEGSISINVLKKFAEALDMKFVYGFIPKEGSLEKMIEKRAYDIAREVVRCTSVNMSLEDQKNTNERLNKAVKERAEEIIREMPRYLWEQNKKDMFSLKDYIPEKELDLFCKKHKIKSLSLFGSAIRNELKPESDIDILIEFEKGCTPGLITFMGIQQELAVRIGRQVDLRTPYDLSDNFRDSVVAESKAEYVSRR
ncbi:MAG: mobile mystery protein A [Candidatus Delongbacteria bacterium]|nr:mobile mystery protein A [Candidatus Delongbacteria bacterium]MCG2759957.1 mobile mystery protein A [Candidatus Delongbacteria bacterium]